MALSTFEQVKEKIHKKPPIMLAERQNNASMTSLRSKHRLTFQSCHPTDPKEKDKYKINLE